MPVSKIANEALDKLNSNQLEKLGVNVGGKDIEVGQYIPKAGKFIPLDGLS